MGVSVFTDQDSATAGLQIQFSSNNTNWDINNNYKIFANQGEYHAVQVKARYCRIVYTNGGVAQTTFRLQTIYGNGNKLVDFKSSGSSSVEYSSTSLVGKSTANARETLVPVKVSAENGAIQPGDLLVTSSIPGYAMQAGENPPQGTVIGKALEPLEDGTGFITMVVTLQ